MGLTPPHRKIAIYFDKATRLGASHGRLTAKKYKGCGIQHRKGDLYMATTENNWTKTKRYRDLRNALLSDLRADGRERLPYTELVEQYMTFWIQLQMLNADIAERGVNVEYQNGKNQNGTTDNKSVATAVRVNARMEAILAALGYKDKNIKPGAALSGEDDEL